MAWDERHLALMDWLNADAPDRLYRNLEELAEHLGVSDVTLWRWQKEPGFDQARIKRANLTFHLKSNQILNAMFRNLLRSDSAKEQVQWLRYGNAPALMAMERGVFDDVRDGGSSTRPELTPELLQEKLRDIPEELRPKLLDVIASLNMLPQPQEISYATPMYKVVKDIEIPEPEPENAHRRAGRRKGSVRKYQPAPDQDTDTTEN